MNEPTREIGMCGMSLYITRVCSPFGLERYFFFFVRVERFRCFFSFTTPSNCKMPHETNEFGTRVYKSRFFFLSSHTLFNIDIKLCIYTCVYDRLKIPIHALNYFNRERKNVKQMEISQNKII